MNARQILRLMELLRGRENDILYVEITQRANIRESLARAGKAHGRTWYQVEISTLKPDGKWELTMDETLKP